MVHCGCVSDISVICASLIEQRLTFRWRRFGKQWTSATIWLSESFELSMLSDCKLPSWRTKVESSVDGRERMDCNSHVPGVRLLTRLFTSAQSSTQTNSSDRDESKQLQLGL